MNKPTRATDTPLPTEVEANKTYYWCSCGDSKTQPFCDGSQSYRKVTNVRRQPQQQLNENKLMNTFSELAEAKAGDRFSTSGVLQKLKFDHAGLIPAIAQQYDTRKVLMMAWMNQAALNETLASGTATYWSRSRKSLWRKGETSGQTQQLKSIRIDCDGDTLLLTVDQTGPACHTGRESCFFCEVDDQEISVLDNPLISPEQLYKK